MKVINIGKHFNLGDFRYNSGVFVFHGWWRNEKNCLHIFSDSGDAAEFCR